MSTTRFTNVMIFDGSGNDPFPSEVLVEGNRISTVTRGTNQVTGNHSTEVVDGGGACLMPGLVEAHGHISFTDVTMLKELGNIPPEEHLLKTMHNAKLLLDSGFTSVYSAASAKSRTEVVIRNEIDAGRIPGPRIRAASPEITSTGGVSDERQTHMYHQGCELIADGVDELRKTVRYLSRGGGGARSRLLAVMSCSGGQSNSTCTEVQIPRHLSLRLCDGRDHRHAGGS